MLFVSQGDRGKAATRRDFTQRRKERKGIVLEQNALLVNSISSVEECDLWIILKIFYIKLLLLLYGGAGGVKKFENVDNCEKNGVT